MNRKLIFAVALFSAFVIFAPAFAQTQTQAPAPAWPPIVSKFVASARKHIKTTDMAGYLSVVKNPNGVLLLDVREQAEFADGHVPGAVNIPRGMLEFMIYKQLGYPNKVDVNKKIYVQCKTGGRASLAAETLKKIGFKEPIAIIMNWDDWVKAGNPSVK